MREQHIDFIPVRLSRGELARRTGLSLEEQAEAERGLERLGYGLWLPNARRGDVDVPGAALPG